MKTLGSRWSWNPWKGFLALMGTSLCGLGLLLVFACNSPFIPIPPPDPTFGPPAMNSDGVLEWPVTSPANAAMSNATVYFINENLPPERIGRIFLARPDGSYSGEIEGQPNDRIDIQFKTPAGAESLSICRLLKEGVANTGCP